MTEFLLSFFVYIFCAGGIVAFIFAWIFLAELFFGLWQHKAQGEELPGLFDFLKANKP